jgi:hypothetical protein
MRWNSHRARGAKRSRRHHKRPRVRCSVRCRVGTRHPRSHRWRSIHPRHHHSPRDILIQSDFITGLLSRRLMTRRSPLAAPHERVPNFCPTVGLRAARPWHQSLPALPAYWKSSTPKSVQRCTTRPPWLVWCTIKLEAGTPNRLLNPRKKRGRLQTRRCHPWRR